MLLKCASNIFEIFFCKVKLSIRMGTYYEPPGFTGRLIGRQVMLPLARYTYRCKEKKGILCALLFRSDLTPGPQSVLFSLQFSTRTPLTGV